jgi:hypothetical protein
MGDDVSVNSETLLLIDFTNLKIKPTQSFKSGHKDKLCIYVFIEINTPTYITTSVFTVFVKNSPSADLSAVSYGRTHYQTDAIILLILEPSTLRPAAPVPRTWVPLVSRERR